jgi:hypothetical protein
MRCLYAFVVSASMAMPVHAGQIAYAVRSTEIKQQPYSDAATIATLNEKAGVDILARQGGWVKVSSEQGKGWVKMFSLRSDSAVKKPGDSGLQSMLNVARTGSSGITVATGVRGLTEEDLNNAQPNPGEFAKLQNYAANKAKAEKFAHDAKLKSRQLDYLPTGGNP